MSEILLTEKAKHYLLSGNSLGETVTVTISPNEVNVFVRFSTPGQPPESNVIAQVTTIDKQNYSFLLKQVQHIADTEGVKDDKELAQRFLNTLDGYLKLVEDRRVRDNDSISQPLLHSRNGIKDLLDQLG
jgi:hypothetical protein